MSNFERFLSCVLADERITDLYQRAYVIATVRHETDRRWFTKRPEDIWLPCDEIGKGKDKRYGIPLNGHVYYGRGFCQLTSIGNYRKFSEILGVDLVLNPDLAKDYETGYKILSIGMSQGLFTGQKLSDFVGAERRDYVGARRVVNGIDRAQIIATYAARFERLLVTIRETGDTQ